jgi:hypothetical protein
MRSLKPSIIFLLLGCGILLTGCSGPNPLTFVGTLAFQLCVFLSIAYAIHTSTENRSFQLGTSALVSVILSAVVLFFSDARTNLKFVDRLSTNNKISIEVASLLFGIVIASGSIFALFLVQLTWVFPRTTLYALVSAPVLLGFLHFVLSKAKNRTIKNLVVYSLIGVWFGLLPGSLLAAGFLALEIAMPLVILLVGISAVGYLAHQAWLSSNFREKFGVYMVVCILAYELWLLLGGVILAWDNTLLRQGALTIGMRL